MASAPIRHRHILHLGGYEPVDPAGLHRRIGRELERYGKNAGVKVRMTDAEVDPDGIAARWRIEAEGPDGPLAVTYEMLRWDEMVARGSAMPVWRLLARAAVVCQANIMNGVVAKLFRTEWRFGVAYLFQYIALALMVGAPLAAGLLAGWLVGRLSDAGGTVAVATGLVATGATLVWTLRVARRYAVMQMSSAWLFVHDWARGLRPDFDSRLDAFAQRLVAAGKAGDADEIILVGHSCGGIPTIPLLGRALDLDPDLPRRGARLALMNLGSVFPILAFHPRAEFARDAIRRVYADPDIDWAEVTALKDPLGCYRYDPPKALGLPPAQGREHPAIWGVHLRRMMGDERYARNRLNFMRLHYQYVMANAGPYAYDFYALVCGSRTLAEWVAARKQVKVKTTLPQTPSGLA